MNWVIEFFIHINVTGIATSGIREKGCNRSWVQRLKVQGKPKCSISRHNRRTLTLKPERLT